jgi:hypothetical protein
LDVSVGSPRPVQDNENPQPQMPSPAVISGGNEIPYYQMNRQQIDSIAPMERHGSKEKGTHAAHILSHEVSKSILASKSGPKIINPVENKETIKQLQSSDNLRIKTEKGNTVTDRKMDRQIMEKYHNNEHLTTKQEILRAQQMYQTFHNIPEPTRDMQYLGKKIGEMTVHDGQPGRPPMIKNLYPIHPVDVDLRSSGVKTQAVRFTKDGKVDERSSACKDGSVLVTIAGDVDRRSSMCKQGKLNPLPDSSSFSSSAKKSSVSSNTTTTTSSSSTSTTSSSSSGESSTTSSSSTPTSSNSSGSSGGVHVGPRGGTYTITASGNKSYSGRNGYSSKGSKK